MDYNECVQKISNEEDKILFEECLKIVECGQYRAAYVLIWIACVESIIRRFKDIMQFDNEAGKLYGKITKIEEGRQATDKNVISYAKKYGFIDDIEHTKLLNIYQLRCIFVHPYNQSPSKEELDAAISNVVDIVLAKPLLLTKGYISRELEKLTTKKEYIGDYYDAIVSYAEEFYQKIDKTLFEYFIEKYWKALETFVYKPEQKIFLSRGMLITKYLLSKYGQDLIKANSFHEIVLANDFVPLYVLTEPDLYNELNGRTQDTIVANAINSEQYKYYKIKLLEPLYINECLSQENKTLVKNCLSILTIEDAERYNFSLFSVYEQIIAKLKSYNWYEQSPAIKFIRRRSISELYSLTEIQQEILGRNILQVANGNEKEANNYLDEIKNNPNNYPVSYIKGIIFEIFINEQNLIRYKEGKIKEIIEIIEKLSNESLETIINELLRLLENGNYKYCIDNYEDIINSKFLKNCLKFAPIINLLEQKFDSETNIDK